MGKKAAERTLGPTEARAVINRIRISPRKLNLIAGLIRGMDVSHALTQLSFSSKRVAGEVRKALQSAIANAENNHNLNVDSLYVKEAYVGKNLVMKRMHTRGRGRSARILKPFANLTLIVRERGEDNNPASRKAVAQDQARQPRKPAAKKKSNPAQRKRSQDSKKESE